MSAATHLTAWTHHHPHFRWPPEWTGAVMAVVLSLLVLAVAWLTVLAGTDAGSGPAPEPPAPAPGPPVQPGTALR